MPAYPNRFSPEEVHVIEKQPAQKEKERKKAARAIRIYAYIVIAFLVLFWVATNIFIRVQVSGYSMSPTYEHGQVIWASRWKKPDYNSVVILTNPYYGIRDNEPEIILKRIWGFGGDSFWLDNEGNLWRKSGEETQKIQQGIEGLKVSSIISFGDALKQIGQEHAYIVPEDCIFVLGDNINNSEDSRYYGGVSVDSVKGVIYT